MFFDLSSLGIIAKKLPQKRHMLSGAILRALMSFHKPSFAF